VALDDRRRCVVTYPLPPCRPYHEEFAHDSGLRGETANQREPGEVRALPNQITGAVGLAQVAAQPVGLEATLRVRHRAPELRQVVLV
jgi:hypothetical protein